VVPHQLRHSDRHPHRVALLGLHDVSDLTYQVLSDSDLPAGGQKIVNISSALRSSQLGHSWRGYVYGGDSPGGDMVGNVTEHHSVRQGSGQILTKRHLESVLYLLSEMMDVTLLHGRSLRLSLGGEVDAGVSLILALAHSWGLG